MNIFKKYKSNSIAITVTFILYAILFVLLNFIPSTESSLMIDDDFKIKNEAIQFQLMEELASPPPSENQVDESMKSSQKSNKEIQAKEIDNKLDESKDLHESNDVNNVIENQDSVLLSQLKKSMAVFKEIIPIDSLEKKPIQQMNEKKVRQALTDRTQFTAEDWQFIRNNFRTIQNINRVYPYVLKTKEIVNKLNIKLATISNKSEKSRLIKNTEKELLQNFENDVRKMSYSQGKLLLKLIARETNQSAYSLIKTYKGGIPATFWYGVGLLFDENLKVKYDSIGEDSLLEKIILKHKLGKF